MPNGSRGAAALLGVAAVASGLIAGVWYAYATSVMLALGDSDDRTFVDVMNRINEVIQNPAFFATFLGAPLLTAIAAAVLRRSPAIRWIIAALVLHVAMIVVTGAFNIPLNNDLAAAGSVADPAAARESFEVPWNAWNLVRLVVSTAALGCLGRALVLHGRAVRAVTPAERA